MVSVSAFGEKSTYEISSLPLSVLAREITEEGPGRDLGIDPTAECESGVTDMLD